MLIGRRLPKSLPGDPAQLQKSMRRSPLPGRGEPVVGKPRLPKLLCGLLPSDGSPRFLFDKEPTNVMGGRLSITNYIVEAKGKYPQKAPLIYLTVVIMKNECNRKSESRQQPEAGRVLATANKKRWLPALVVAATDLPDKILSATFRHPEPLSPLLRQEELEENRAPPSVGHRISPFPS